MPEIASMTLGELATWVVVGITFLATFIEVAPIKINPWTRLAQKVGRAINGEVIAKVETLESEFRTFRAASAEQDAKSARYRILRFGDECLHDVRHSKEHFDQILRDVTDYENYCRQHPEFENDQAVETIASLKETYRVCLRERKFLPSTGGGE